MTADASSPAAEFAQVAKGFCVWCEAEALAGEPRVLASSWLAKLHAAALALPDAPPENEFDSPHLPEAAEARARRNLAALSSIYYREFYDPSPSLADEAVMGNVGDDLTDTYLDVRAGLVQYQEGKLTAALWHWSFLHRIHWGRHAVGAMFALQSTRNF